MYRHVPVNPFVAGRDTIQLQLNKFSNCEIICMEKTRYTHIESLRNSQFEPTQQAVLLLWFQRKGKLDACLRQLITAQVSDNPSGIYASEA